MHWQGSLLGRDLLRWARWLCWQVLEHPLQTVQALVHESLPGFQRGTELLHWLEQVRLQMGLLWEVLLVS